MSKRRVVHILYSLRGPGGPQTVCGHYVNPGTPKSLLTETDPRKVTCKSCKTSWRKPAGAFLALPPYTSDSEDNHE